MVTPSHQKWHTRCIAEKFTGSPRTLRPGSTACPPDPRTTVGTGLLGHGVGLEEGEEEIVIRPADRIVATMRCPDPFNPEEHWYPPFDLQARGTGADPAVMGAAPLDAVLDLP